MSDNNEFSIEVEIYQKVVEEMLLLKDKEILGLKIHVAQLQSDMDKIKSKTDNITNDVK